ncbi:MAG: ATP-binding cassette domain-containing protein [Bacteroidota bacterium]
MIVAENVCKSFDDKQVLDGVSAEFETEKTNLIIGSSGTGKSVFLKCIVGLIKPDQGSITFNGRDLTGGDKEVQTEIRREMGMLFQGSALFDSSTVEQNVMFPLNVLSQMSPEEKLDRVNFCLERVGLENVNSKMPSEISGGMKKRVGIARAIVNKPNYLFCDEPNSGLDPQTSILIDNLIKDITDEYKMTTVVVTHDMNSVLEIGDKINFLYQGKKLWEGSSQEITNSGIQELDDFVFATSMMKLTKNL